MSFCRSVIYWFILITCSVNDFRTCSLKMSEESHLSGLSQQIPFIKMTNFRELGGYKASDGRRIKHNIFFRSSKLCNLSTEEDYEKFKSFGIKVIIDFRSVSERELKPDPIFDGIKQYNISALYKKDGSEMNFDFQDIVLLSSQELIDLKNLLEEGYEVIGFNNPAYKQMFKDIVEGNVPILFHCSAGKDRTGIAAALILALFGVDREDIAYDYMMTNRFNHTEIERRQKAMKETLPPESQSIVMSLSGVSRENLELTLNSILKKYETFENYFEKEYGITEEIRKQLMDRYLE